MAVKTERQTERDCCDVTEELLSRCSVFYASAIGTNGDPIKLPLVLREESENVEPTVIFDYKHRFLPALNQYALGGGPVPDPRVFLLIGSQTRLADVDDNVPIYATIASSRALRDIKTVSDAMVSLSEKHFAIVTALTYCGVLCCYTGPTGAGDDIPVRFRVGLELGLG